MEWLSGNRYGELLHESILLKESPSVFARFDDDGDDDGNNDGDDENDVATTRTPKKRKKRCENHAKRSETSRKRSENDPKTAENDPKNIRQISCLEC